MFEEREKGDEGIEEKVAKFKNGVWKRWSCVKMEGLESLNLESKGKGGIFEES